MENYSDHLTKYKAQSRQSDVDCCISFLNKDSQSVEAFLEAVAEYNEAISIAGQQYLTQHRYKIKALYQLLDQINILEDKVLSIQESSVKTRLLAFSTLIETCYCESKSRSLSCVVYEINDVCLRSESYLIEIQNNIKKTYHALQSMITSKNIAIRKDLDFLQNAKTQIEMSMEKLLIFEAFLSDITRSSNDACVEIDRQQSMQLICQRMQQNMICLTSVGISLLPVLSRIEAYFETIMSHAPDPTGGLDYIIPEGFEILNIQKFRHLMTAELSISINQ